MSFKNVLNVTLEVIEQEDLIVGINLYSIFIIGFFQTEIR